MPCYYPSEIRVRRKAGPDRPPQQRTSWQQVVPCGRCLGCRSDQGREWAIRLLHESITTEPAYFLTLTYADETVPDYGRLNPKHLRAFVQRLRRKYSERRVSYYMVGEYGDKFQRPHYHAVCFGADLGPFLDLDTSSPHPVYRSPALEELWPHGHSQVTHVTFASASYVAGYVQKKAGLKPSDHPKGYERIDQETGEEIFLPMEFARMSLNPAIGLQWLKKYHRDVYPRDYVVLNGTEFKPPRYYDKVYVDPKHDLPGISYPERVRIMELVKERRLAEQPDLTEYQLMAKAAAHKNRHKLRNPRFKQ